TRDELVGCVVDILVPEPFRRVHGEYRSAYFREPRPRQMGSASALLARRKDGSQFPVEISLSPMLSEERLLVSATIRDTTEQAQALREKETLLKEIHHRV